MLTGSTPSLQDNRTLLLRRLKIAHTAISQDRRVAGKLIAAIGFCMGGLCVLDMVRAGLPLISAVSFHGLLMGIPGDSTAHITTPLLILHGFDDPLVAPEQVLRFQQEMTARQADWQLHTFGDTAHAFTNPTAKDKKGGNYFQRESASRAYQLAQQFLATHFINTIR